MPKKQTSERKYTHSIVTYATRDEIQPLLDESKHWALILHDKDDVDPHYHILAIFEKWKSYNQVRNMIHSNSNTFAKEYDNDVGGAISYFVHEGIPNKHQYKREDIEFDSAKYWSNKADVQITQDTEQFIDDLVQQELSDLEMARKYGKDYIRNRNRYKEFATIVRDEYIDSLMKDMPKNTDYSPYSHKWWEGYVTVDITQEEWQLIQNFRNRKEILENEKIDC